MEEIFTLFGIGDIGGDGHRSVPQRLNHARGLLEGLRASAGEHQVSPVFSKDDRSGAADAAAATGDECHAASQ